jgi:hypothetical protein
MPIGEIPQQTNLSTEYARNKLLRVKQSETLLINDFQSAYEDFWGVSGAMQDVTDPETEDVTTVFVGSGSRHTVAEMNAILNEMEVLVPGSVMDVLTDAGQFRNFVNTAYPGVLPERYHLPAFVLDTSSGTVQVTELSPTWAVPDLEREDNE